MWLRRLKGTWNCVSAQAVHSASSGISAPASLVVLSHFVIRSEGFAVRMRAEYSPNGIVSVIACLRQLRTALI